MSSLFQRLSAASQAFHNSFRNINTTSSAVPSVPSSGNAATPFGTGPRYGTNASFSIKQLNEMTPVDRATSIKESLFVTGRLGLGRALVENSCNYAIGSGLTEYSASGDQAYDDSCNKFVNSIFESRRFDISEEHDFYAMQGVALQTMMVKGDLGTAKILRRNPKSGSIISGPQIQMFQSEDIASNSLGSIAARSASQWREGIQYDDYRKRTAFRVQTNADASAGFGLNQNWKEYEARDFVFTLDGKRPHLGRGMPWIHHATGSCMKMMDLVELETKVAYLNSLFGAYLETPTGELPIGFDTDVINKRSKKNTEDKDGKAVEKPVTRRFAEFLGGALMPVFAAGEKLGFFKSERPSLTFTGFIDWLVNDIALGFGLPPSFIWAIAGRTGPETRLVLEQADWFFTKTARILTSGYVDPIREWVIDYGLLTSKINGGHPPNNGSSPYMRRVRGPKKVTIDPRYHFKTWIERLNNGLGTEEEFYAELGLDRDTEKQTRVNEVAAWQRLCEKAEVPYERVIRSMPGQSNGTGDLDPEQLAEMLRQHAN